MKNTRRQDRCHHRRQRGALAWPPPSASWKEGATVALTDNASKSGADEAVAAIEKAEDAFAIHADSSTRRRPDACSRDWTTSSRRRERKQGHSTFWSTTLAMPAIVGFQDATPDSWDRPIAVYARAPFFIVQAALPVSPTADRIINISSAAATKPVTAAPIYSMAKAAMQQPTHALASELGPRGITRERRSAGLHANRTRTPGLTGSNPNS